ncbi:MAG: hypothetical protein A3G59_02210 [Candidatus Taylorbacteria bacterium RIFCSPLOWO2_12_FULL_47_20]|uniref:Uncharacterized protein n=2 Tax=Candidatus Tayloriibacteriota TaxID=1817919 RepID=A0A1G2P804_9BACT|nr:MAG: hypothetical protein A3H68_03715 [Candidatus Taylorbacteria bacterium RIFCSPLOWO2_02_FULL_46_40]OHA44495.1 MAG: hypothetical protein A3G59_02210 [Candidatus Taylorbacteria bacterium RIFCSPLOWO2_12_FULL_47_20]
MKLFLNSSKVLIAKRAAQNSLRDSKTSPKACPRHDEGAVEESQQNFAWRSGETSMYFLRFSCTSG